MQQTPLYDEHLQLQGRMVPFAGWEMPVQYADGIIAEHEHTRRHAGLFDICHMGEFRVRGPGAAEALDRRLARSVADQPVGSCRYNLLLNEEAGILDDLVVYRLDGDEFLIVVNAGCRESDAAALAAALPSGVDFLDQSDATAKLDLQGPESARVLAELGWAGELPRYYRWSRGRLAGIEILLSRTGYTGELGYELYCPADRAVELWRKLLEHPSVKPIGLGARDTLRLEVGYPLYGHELDDAHTPDESGLSAKTFSAAADRAFTGREAWRTHRPASFIKGLKIDGRRAARAGMNVISGDRVLGEITSGAFAPSLGCAVALARLDHDLPAGTQLAVNAGRVTLNAEIVETPFYTEGTARIPV